MFSMPGEPCRTWSPMRSVGVVYRGSAGSVFITGKSVGDWSGQVNNLLPAILITVAARIVIISSGWLIIDDCRLLLRIINWLHLLIRLHINSLGSTINNILLIIWTSLVARITLIVLIISPLEASSIAKSEAPRRSCLDFWKDQNDCQKRDCD